jgi:Xaa-Pro aminopeptidase
MARPKISIGEFRQRTAGLQKLMEQNGTDLFLAFGNEAEPQFLRYLCDYWPSFETAGVLLAQKGEPVLLIGPESMTYASERSVIPDIRRLPSFRESSNPEYPGHKLDGFETVIESLGLAKIGKMAVAGYNLMPKVIFDDLQAALERFGKTEIVRGDDMMMSLRMIKSEDELACMRYAAKITAGAFDYVVENMKAGMTESQLRGLACAKIFELGAESEAYPMWFLAGEGGNQAISRARHKVIAEGDIVHMQIGARYEGYAASIGRPVILGEPKRWMADAIRAGYEAQDAICAQLYGGNNARNVANAYYGVMTKNGYAGWLLYGPCHGTGLMEGEPPWIESDSNYLLHENMTYCADIFMGTNEGYGFRIEDSVRVGRKEAENLTNYKKEVIIIK